MRVLDSDVYYWAYFLIVQAYVVIGYLTLNTNVHCLFVFTLPLALAVVRTMVMCAMLRVNFKLQNCSIRLSCYQIGPTLCIKLSNTTHRMQPWFACRDVIIHLEEVNCVIQFGASTEEVCARKFWFRPFFGATFWWLGSCLGNHFMVYIAWNIHLLLDWCFWTSFSCVTYLRAIPKTDWTNF